MPHWRLLRLLSSTLVLRSLRVCLDLFLSRSVWHSAGGGALSRGWWSTLQLVVEYSPVVSSLLPALHIKAGAGMSIGLNLPCHPCSMLELRLDRLAAPYNANNSTIEKTCYLIRSNRLCYILCYFSQKYGWCYWWRSWMGLETERWMHSFQVYLRHSVLL